MWSVLPKLAAANQLAELKYLVKKRLEWEKNILDIKLLLQYCDVLCFLILGKGLELTSLCNIQVLNHKPADLLIDKHIVFNH